MRRAASLVAAVGALAGALLLAIPPPARSEEEQPASEVSASPPTAVPEENYPALHIIGFTDVDYFVLDEPRTPESGLFEGQFVLHFVSVLSRRFTFFGEVSLTARKDAATSASSPGFNAEVERSILKFTRSDRLKVSVGRYHTPINYWNTAFHHGAWLQTTAARPEMIQFGGHFLPVHFVGGLVEGTLPAGAWGFDYGLGVGNGRSSVISRAGDATDVNDSRAWLASVGVKPGLYGLQVGGAYYRDVVTLASGDHREWIGSAHLAFTKETPEIIAEWAHVVHRDPRTDRTSGNDAYYVQAAYLLPFDGKRLKPYGRWERIDVDPLDPVFLGFGLVDRKGFILGARYDASDLVALKAEYRRQRSAVNPYVNALFAQVSFTF